MGAWQPSGGGGIGGVKRQSYAASMLASVATNTMSSRALSAGIDEQNPGMMRVIENFTETRGWKILQACFFVYMVLTCITVHGVYYLYYCFVNILLGRGYDNYWNCIFLEDCPFALFPVWIAIWLMLWAQTYFLAFRNEVQRRTESKMGLAMATKRVQLVVVVSLV
jgi:hypothetical protein